MIIEALMSESERSSTALKDPEWWRNTSCSKFREYTGFGPSNVGKLKEGIMTPKSHRKTRRSDSQFLFKQWTAD